ncbi:endonuclease/exonuclease/phosphatase family protein [Nakamurella lactea]|jgi:endonuclease/exonuclease/phosphatase family metal-dependent hydrolase|uniref:endonuclease/exonuclease/phosphatase family protein n=1 Tax=Nakamurella lactea TaxID=459515 RepID=UPI0004124C3F|nr:endonuclease/exonuclease/phosphatase family protein [Nakamurella lactea]
MTTVVVQTHNLWGDTWAQERSAALGRLYCARPPDLLATQELRPWSRDVLDAAMPDHERVDDGFPGWQRQSNIWWRSDLFARVGHGAEDVGILDADARLFWVRLRRADGGGTLLMSTAHLSYAGTPIELASGVNQRVPQALRVIEELAKIAGEDEPVLFAVDINDIGVPLWTFGNGGYLDAFSALGRHCPPTHPVIPSGFAETVGTTKSPVASPPKAIDWIYFRGPVRPRVAEVIEYFHRGVSPSDHAAVVAAFSLDPQ